MTLYSMIMLDDPKLVSDFEFCTRYNTYLIYQSLSATYYVRYTDRVGDGTRINTKLSNLNSIVPQRAFFT